VHRRATARSAARPACASPRGWGPPSEAWVDDHRHLRRVALQPECFWAALVIPVDAFEEATKDLGDRALTGTHGDMAGIGQFHEELYAVGVDPLRRQTVLVTELFAD